MSDRTTRSPQRALAELGADINTRLARAARRIKWHSGIPDVSDVGPITTTMGVYDSTPPLPIGLNSVLASFDIDPGRWTIFASSYWSPIHSSAVIGGSIMRIEAGGGEVGDAFGGGTILGESVMSCDVGPSGFQAPHWVSGAFTATEETTIWLLFEGQSVGGVGTSRVFDVRMSAVGG
jgi:hypothetical protein